MNQVIVRDTTRSSGVDGAGARRLMTTGEAARLLGVSRQTVVIMCESGDIPYVQVGTHRKIDPQIVQALRDRPRRRPNSARRSLWLAHAAAGALVLVPDRVRERARMSLHAMLAASPRGMSRQWLARWQELLDGPVDAILKALTGTTVEHDELRQHSPLTGALTAFERQAVLDAFLEDRQRGRPGKHADAMPA